MVLLILSLHFALVGGWEHVPGDGLHHTELEISLYSPDFPTLVFLQWKELVTTLSSTPIKGLTKKNVSNKYVLDKLTSIDFYRLAQWLTQLYP